MLSKKKLHHVDLVCTYICVPVQFVGLTAVLFCPALVLLGRFVQQEIKFVWPFVKLNIYFIHITVLVLYTFANF